MSTRREARGHEWAASADTRLSAASNSKIGKIESGAAWPAWGRMTARSNLVMLAFAMNIAFFVLILWVFPRESHTFKADGPDRTQIGDTSPRYEAAAVQGAARREDGVGSAGVTAAAMKKDESSDNIQGKKPLVEQQLGGTNAAKSATGSGATAAAAAGAAAGAAVGAAGGVDDDSGILVLLVISDSIYQEWQARSCLYHLRKLNQPGRVMTLMSTTDRAAINTEKLCAQQHSLCPLFVTGDYSKAPTGDYFIVYNRAHAIREYIEHLQQTGELSKFHTVVIIEPDMIPLKPFTQPAVKGKPYGHHYFYMEAGYSYNGLNNTALIHYCAKKHPELVVPVGVPFVMHMDDLIELLPVWIERSVDMRLPQPWTTTKERSWIADMWGFACGAADLDMRCIADKQFGPETGIDWEISPASAVIHFTYGFWFDEVEFRFEKRDWSDKIPAVRPFPPLPPKASPLQKMFMDKLNEALVAVYGRSDAK